MPGPSQQRGELAPPVTSVVTTNDGERLFFGEWPGTGEQTFIALHGLTNQHRNLAGVADHLDPRIRVIAPDLRGRGASSTAPAGAYGMLQHAQDVLHLMDETGVERAVVGGHSMGAYVATQLAILAPERVAGVVLLDGGVWVDADAAHARRTVELVEAVTERLGRVFPSPEAYLDLWRGYPQFANGLDDVAESNLRYDVGRVRDGYAPKCAPVAAREDLVDATRADARTEEVLRTLDRPVLAIGAEWGILMDPNPVLGDAHFACLRELVDDVTTMVVPETDHHTIVLTRRGARRCAEAVQTFIARVDPTREGRR